MEGTDGEERSVLLKGSDALHLNVFLFCQLRHRFK